MIVRSLAIALVSAALFAPAVVAAEVEQQPIEEKKLASGRQTLSPDKGYVYLHAPERATILLIKEPSAEELAAYQAEWREELAKAREKYFDRIAHWDEEVTYARNHQMTRPVRPAEPTEQNFAIDRIELRMIVSIGPQFVYAKQGEEFSYLHELEPGTYRYYGPVFVAPNGAATGVCACMGSVRFEVKPGAVTNLGDLLVTAVARVAEAPLGSNLDGVQGPVDYALPERLAAFPNQPADWRAAGKMDNFYGLMIGRMPPMPGVLAYERDTVIDVKAAASTGGAREASAAP